MLVVLLVFCRFMSCSCKLTSRYSRHLFCSTIVPKHRHLSVSSYLIFVYIYLFWAALLLSSCIAFFWSTHWAIFSDPSSYFVRIVYYFGASCWAAYCMSEFSWYYFISWCIKAALRWPLNLSISTDRVNWHPTRSPSIPFSMVNRIDSTSKLAKTGRSTSSFRVCMPYQIFVLKWWWICLLVFSRTAFPICAHETVPSHVMNCMSWFCWHDCISCCIVFFCSPCEMFVLRWCWICLLAIFRCLFPIFVYWTVSSSFDCCFGLILLSRRSSSGLYYLLLIAILSSGG